MDQSPYVFEPEHLRPCVLNLEAVEWWESDWDVAEWAAFWWSNDPEEYESQPAAQPTAFEPGSPAKQKILRARAAHGEALRHPMDAEAAPDEYCRRGGEVAGGNGRNGARQKHASGQCWRGPLLDSRVTETRAERVRREFLATVAAALALRAGRRNQKRAA